MPSKTAARSGARSSRSKAGSRGGARRRGPRRPAASRLTPQSVGHLVRGGDRRARRSRGLVDGGQGRRIHRPLGRSGARPGARPPPRRHRAGAAGHRRGDRRELLVRRRASRRPVDRHLPSRADRVGRRPRSDRARRGRRGADAHGTRPRSAATADPRRRDDHPAHTRTVASVGGFADGPDRAPARRRIPRLRHRRSAVGWADRVDRRAAAVHRRTVRPAAGDRHDDPRGAVDRAADVLCARIPR